MFLTALALLQPAAAEPAGDVACEPLYVTASRPSVGQTGVARDARMVALLEGNCGPASTYELSLVRIDESGEELVLQTASLDGQEVWDSGVALLTPDEALEPGAPHIFRILPGDGWGEMTEIAFTTGEGWVSDNGELRPTLDLWSAELYDEGDGAFGLRWSAQGEVVEDPDQLALLAVLDPWDSERFLTLGAPEAGVVPLWGYVALGEPLDRLCLEAVRLDGAGGWSLPSESTCMDTDPSSEPRGRWFGCSFAPGAASLLPALLALAALRRR